MPVEVSLYPVHLERLEVLQKRLRKNRSELLRDLIDTAYNCYKHSKKCSNCPLMNG
ncbi:ribbon-helix-helix protein, CopG family [Archaeoglobus veneficus]|uniref:Ribbon-helix-helix protein CopG domain-containing protein n=1 Tax=Archaeoglobus veneficus pleomorphic virus 1 TaxID=3115750 RepID=A0AAT9JIA4_9VIRU